MVEIPISFPVFPVYVVSMPFTTVFLVVSGFCGGISVKSDPRESCFKNKNNMFAILRKNIL
jgi:hypothetical protein